VPQRFIDVETLGIAEIPKAPNGKVLRSKIKELLRDNFKES